MVPRYANTLSSVKQKRYTLELEVLRIIIVICNKNCLHIRYMKLMLNFALNESESDI